MTSMNLTAKTGNLGGLKGNYYQVRFLMWLYQRVADESLTHYKAFELTTEMKAAGVFDDAVLTWIGTEGEQNWLFVQVKHKISQNKLTRQHFFPAKESDEFSLYKYLVTFLDIERRQEFKGKKQYVIFTNSDVDDAILNCFESVENVTEDVLKIPGSEARLIKIKIEKNSNAEKNISEIFCDELLQYSNREFNSLAEAFTAIFIQGRSNFNTDVFRQYRGAIVRKILTVDKIEPVKVKFTKNFIYEKNLDPSEQSLRIKVFGDISIQDLKEYNSTNQQLIEVLKSKQKSDSKLPLVFDMDRDIKPFFEKLIFAVNQPNNENLLKLTTYELESRHGSLITDPISLNNFSSLGRDKLEDMVHECLGSKEVMYLKKDRLLEELRTAKHFAIYPDLDFHTKTFKSEIQKLGVEFKLIDVPVQQVPLAIITNTQKGLLSSIKLHQMLESTDEKIPYLYFSFKNLGSMHDFSMRIRKMLLDYLENRSMPLYLLLQDDGSDTDFSEELLKVAQTGNSLQLILLTHKVSRASDFFREASYSVHEDDADNLSTLSEQSQQMLESRQINFQGFEIPLTELPGYKDLQPIFRDEVLEQLILGATLTIGPNLPKMKTKNYISRKIHQQQLINRYFKNGLLQENIDIIRYNEEQFLEAVPELFKQNKIIVLSSIPGMGKSTLWSRLAQVVKQQHRSKCIIYIKLQELSNYLQTDSMTIDILCAALSFQSHFEKSLLINLLKSGKPDKIYIFMDGFDEIQHENTEKIISLLRVLHCKARIFVNTREHLQAALEEALEVKAFYLQAMNKADLRELFTSFNRRKPFPISVDRLIDKMESVSMQVTNKFIGAPLIANMLIEIYTTDIGNQKPIDFDSLDILYIFEKFVYSSFYRQQVEKLKLDTKNPYTQQLLDEDGYFYKGFEELQCSLGFKYFSGNENSKMVLMRKDQRDTFQKQALILQSPIVKYVDNRCFFIHSSFAELFVAKYFISHLTSITNDQIHEQCCRTPPRDILLISKDIFYLLFCNSMVRNFFFLLVQRHAVELLEKIGMVLNSKQVFAMQWACEANFEALVECLVRLDPSIAKKSDFVHEAASNNASSICTFLIRNGADVDARNVGMKTPLHTAVSAGHINIVKLLIEHGANNDSIDSNSLTPLDLALHKGHTEIIEYLLSIGSQFNLMLKFKWNNQAEILDFIKKHAGKIKTPQDFGRTVANLIEDKILTCSDWKPTLIWAIENDHSYIIQAMHKVGVNIFKENDSGHHCSHLHRAVEAHAVESMHILLECGANVDEIDEKGFTPLLLAVEKGKPSVAKLLLQKGASATAKSNDGQNVWHLAVQSYVWHTEILKLPKNMSWVDFMDSNTVRQLVIDKNNEGQTPLHLACREREETVKKLIDVGADINSRDNNYKTPLHVAAISGSWNLVRILIQHQANLKVVDNHGMTHLDLAVSRGHKHYVKSCLDHTPCILDSLDVSEALYFANQTEHKEISQLLENYLKSCTSERLPKTHPHTDATTRNTNLT